MAVPFVPIQVVPDFRGVAATISPSRGTEAARRVLSITTSEQARIGASKRVGMTIVVPEIRSEVKLHADESQEVRAERWTAQGL